MKNNAEDKLVSYKDIPYGRYFAKTSCIISISEDEFNSLKGKLEHVNYNNIFTRHMYLQITGRCNFNCLHCFSARDNAPLMFEMPLEKINELLDMAAACGIISASITGGEPTIHPHFKEIVRAFYEKGIVIESLVTNGYLLTQDILDLFKECNMSPIVRLSFDGIGVHDIMRGVQGAEAAALKAIDLCIRNGIELCVNMQVNRKTIDSIPETLKVLDKMGVDMVKLIKTTSTPRWELNCDGDDLTFKEFNDICLEMMDDYSKEDHNMSISVWLLTTYQPKARGAKYDFPFNKAKLRPEADKELFCSDFKDKICIAADGNVYPCLQMQGFMEYRKINLGNIFNDGLQNILQEDSQLFRFKNHTREEKFAHNEKCGDCEYSNICSSGSPCMSLLYHDDILALDDTVCDFYESGMYEKVLSLAGFGVRDIEE